MTTEPNRWLRWNFRHLYIDVVGFGILTGSTIAFLAIYASRLGASAFQVGLLTAGPAAVNLLLSLPIGRWLEGRHLIRASYLSAFWQRFPYFALIFLPFMALDQLELWIIILLVLFMSVPGTILAIAFNAMFAEVVHSEWRGEVVGRRNALVAISVAVTTLVCGQLLNRIHPPYNYPVVFGIGALGAILSTYQLGKIKPLIDTNAQTLEQPILDDARPGLVRFGSGGRVSAGLRFLAHSEGRPLLRVDLIYSSFGLFMFSYLFFYTVQYIPVPIFPLFFVNTLNLTDGQIGVANAIFYTTMFLASLQLKQVSERYGHRRILVASGLLFSLYPLLLGLAQGPYMVWLASLIQGIVWGMMSAALVNRLMDRTPTDDLPAHMALHNLALSLGILAGSIIGPPLGAWLDLRPALWLSAGFRLLGGVVLLFWG